LAPAEAMKFPSGCQEKDTFPTSCLSDPILNSLRMPRLLCLSVVGRFKIKITAPQLLCGAQATAKFRAMNSTHLILNGTAIGVHRSHAYLIFDLSHTRSLMVFVGVMMFIAMAVCICTVRILKFVCECECCDWCFPASAADQRGLMELSTRSSDSMIPRASNV
jgi:hypothetical protein